MNESQIRNALVAKLMDTSAGPNSTFISEMFVDAFARRADLVVVGSKLAAFEIKSERDSLERLDGQLQSYAQFFEQVTIVCATRHLKGLEARVSNEVGIWTITEDGAISKIRNAKTLRKQSADSWLSFLPVDELRSFLRSHNLSAKGYREELLQAAGFLPLRTIRAYVLAYLKRRDERIKALVEKKTRRTASPLLPPRLEDFLKTVSTTPMVAIPRARIHSSNPSTSSPSLSN